MTYNQAIELIERLKNACVYHRFDEPGVHKEYTRFLMKYNYELMNEVIDAAIEDDSRNVPAISVLAKKYRELRTLPKSNISVKNEEYCAVCDDRGFVLMKEKDNDSGNWYEYVLYCPFCALGRFFAYEGSQRSDKERRSPYRVPALTEYFGDEGIQALREENLRRRAMRTKAARPEKADFQKIGKSIPSDWQHDTTSDLPF